MDLKQHVDGAKNSAFASLTSLSGKLQQRRQKLQQMKDDAMNLDKETPKQAADEEEKKVVKRSPEDSIISRNEALEHSESFGQYFMDGYVDEI